MKRSKLLRELKSVKDRQVANSIESAELIDREDELLGMINRDKELVEILSTTGARDCFDTLYAMDGDSVVISRHIETPWTTSLDSNEEGSESE